MRNLNLLPGDPASVTAPPKQLGKMPQGVRGLYVSLFQCGLVAGQTAESRQQSQGSDSHTPMTLANYGLSRTKTDGKPTALSPDLQKQKTSVSNERKLDLNHKNRVTTLPSIPRLEPVYGPRTPSMKGLKKDPVIARSVCCWPCSQPSPKGPVAFQRGTATGEEEPIRPYVGTTGHQLRTDPNSRRRQRLPFAHHTQSVLVQFR